MSGDFKDDDSDEAEEKTTVFFDVSPRHSDTSHTDFSDSIILSKSGIELSENQFHGFQLVKLLGTGGVGEVWLGQKGPEKVAIKLLKDSFADDKETVARFNREAEVGVKIKHDNLVDVFAYGIHPRGIPYIVMELLQGETLTQRIARSPFTYDEACHAVEQICLGLSEAHAEGLVHRDLKPHNIFITSENVVKVLDFGVTKKQDSLTIVTEANRLLGTPSYMAPEQASGVIDEIDARSDIFAIGAVVYEMLCGKRAFGGGNLHDIIFSVVYRSPEPLNSLCPNLPDCVYNTLNIALAKAKVDRFQNIIDFKNSFLGLETFEFQQPQITPHPQADLVNTVTSKNTHTFTVAPKIKSKKVFHWALWSMTGIIALGAFYIVSQRWKRQSALDDTTQNSKNQNSKNTVPLKKETITLVFNVTPRNAKISLDGQRVGQTAEIKKSPKMISLRVSKPGFKTHISTFTPNKKQRFTIVLRRLAKNN